VQGANGLTAGPIVACSASAEPQNRPRIGPRDRPNPGARFASFIAFFHIMSNRRPLDDIGDWRLHAGLETKLRSRPAGSVLYEQGDDVHTVHLIEHGLVKLLRTTAGGRRMVVAIRSPGWVLGAGSALMGAPHAAIAETITAASVHSIDAAAFVRMCHTDVAAANTVARMLARECLDQLQQTATIVLGARQRLQRLLALLADGGTPDTDADGTVRMAVALKHREIAEAIWTSRETVTRLLQVLAADGVAMFRDGALVIPADSPLLAARLRSGARAAG
jgi:CRP-like cAMP-binding protein